MSRVIRLASTEVPSGWSDGHAKAIEGYIEDIDQDFQFGEDPSFDQFKRDALTLANKALQNYIDTAKKIVEFATRPDKFILGLGPIGRNHCCIHTDGHGGYTLHAAKIGNKPWYQRDLISDQRYGKVIVVLTEDNEAFGDDIATAIEAQKFIRENNSGKEFSWFMNMVNLAKKIRKRENYIIKEFRNQLKNRLSEQNGIPTEDDDEEDT